MESNEKIEEARIRTLHEWSSKDIRCKVKVKIQFMFKLQYFTFPDEVLSTCKDLKTENKSNLENEHDFNNIFNVKCNCKTPKSHSLFPTTLIKCIACFQQKFKLKYKIFKETLEIKQIPDHINEQHINKIIKLLQKDFWIVLAYKSNSYMLTINLRPIQDAYMVNHYIVKSKNRKIQNLKKKLFLKLVAYTKSITYFSLKVRIKKWLTFLSGTHSAYE